MTIKEFRSDTERVKDLGEALALPIMQLARQVMKENGPETKVMDLSRITVDPATFVSVRFGEIKGYAGYHLDLAVLATRYKPPVNVEADENSE